VQPRSPLRAPSGWIAVAMVMAATAALADRGLVAVVLKDGSTSSPATFSLRPAVQILVLERDRAHRYISYSDIEAVIDSTNANIAPALLRMHYRPHGLEAAGLEDFIEARSIELKSGKRIGKTRFLLNPDRAELLILSGLDPRAIPWDDIEQIVDHEGRIQSAASLRANQLLVAADAPRTNDLGAGGERPRAALPWRFAVEIQNRFDLPAGAYYKGTDGGAGFGGVAHIAITEEAAVRLSVDLLGVEFDPSIGLLSFGPNVTIISDLDAWRIVLGGEYHQPISAWKPKSGFYFVSAAIGVTRHDVDSKIVVRVGNDFMTGVAGDSEPSMTVSFGAGVLRVIAAPVSVSISGDLSLMQAAGTSGMVAGIRLGLGVVH